MEKGLTVNMDNILRRQCLGHQDFLNIITYSCCRLRRKKCCPRFIMHDKQKLSKHLKLSCQIEGYRESLMSISKVVEAYLVLKSFSVYFATSLVKAWLNTKTETPALDPRRNAGKRDKPLTLGGDWGRRRVMQCAFSICSRGQFEVVYSLKVVCILYNSCVYCTNLLAKLTEIF